MAQTSGAPWPTEPWNIGFQVTESQPLFLCYFSLPKDACHQGPQDCQLPAHSESTACWPPRVSEPLRDRCSATAGLVLRKCLLAECTFEARVSGQEGTFSSPWWGPGKAKWQLFLGRSLTNSLWQWLLILQLCPNLFFALQEIKYFSAWHPLELFFSPAERYTSATNLITFPFPARLICSSFSIHKTCLILIFPISRN